MNNHTTRCVAITGNHRLRRSFATRLGFAGLVVSIWLLAAGCGGGSKHPVVAGAETTTTSAASTASTASGSPGESTQSQELQLAQCMRSNGVPNFPDPSPGGGLLNAISAAGIDTQSPTYKAAFQACEKYAPAGSVTPQTAEDNAEALRFSQCMRSHGVPSYPDPIIGPTGGQAINLGPEHIDPTSPLFQTANTACHKLFPGSK